MTEVDLSGEAARPMESSRNHTRAWAGRVAWRCLPPLIRGVGRLAWRLDVDQGDGLPEPPFVVAANHHSFLDAVLIGAVLRRKVRFLALVDLYGHYRSLDFALGALDAIPLRRDTVPLAPVRTALSHLEDGGAVGLFPEGTRHWEFDPERARPGAAWLAIRADVPLVPVAIVGTDRVLGVDNRLRSGQVRVMVGPPLRGSGSDREAVDDLIGRWAKWIADRLPGDDASPVSPVTGPG